MSYAVQVAPLAVRLVDFQGRSSDGTVFLHGPGERAGDAETLGGRLNDPRAPFLPFRAGDRLELVHLEWVAYVETAASLPEVELRREIGARRARVELELVTGERLAGEFVYVLPAGGSRISDLLNGGGERFLLLVDGETTRYVQRRALVRVWS